MLYWSAGMVNALTLLFSYHRRAWFRDNTLQSNIALFGVALTLATERPIFTGSCTEICRSWNGCELVRQVNTASGVCCILINRLLFRLRVVYPNFFSYVPCWKHFLDYGWSSMVRNILLNLEIKWYLLLSFRKHRQEQLRRRTEPGT